MEDFVLRWNTTYPLDRWLRKKYNLRFNSPEHRSTNLVNAYFEFLEEKVYKQAENEFKESYKRKEEYKKVGWIKEAEIIFDDSVFDDIDYSLFDEDDSTQKDNI